LTELTIPYIKTRFAYWEKILHVQATLNFQWMTTKWGVCNCGTKRIVLALQLGTNDKEAIDYVIVHELAHLYHPNHSVHFWDFVSLYIKNWQELRDKINLKK
jgi:predicted metal-dependent hydrolase